MPPEDSGHGERRDDPLDRPADEADIDRAVAALTGRVVAVATGAGISTDSGIPGYRGEGSVAREPMTISQFLTDERYRARYWAGSQLGLRRFTRVEPNTGHRVIAELERSGIVNGVMTQNVDGLHQQAGTTRVVELHGSGNRIRCLRCGQQFSRDGMSRAIVDQNPWITQLDERELGPDGDVEVSQLDEFRIPSCTVCGGVLRPDIVYFGEFIPATRNRLSAGLIASAGALLVVGSSLVVNSGIRLVNQALRQGKPVVIINRGETRADARATVKIDAGASSALSALAGRLEGNA